MKDVLFPVLGEESGAGVEHEIAFTKFVRFKKDTDRVT